MDWLDCLNKFRTAAAADQAAALLLLNNNLLLLLVSIWPKVTIKPPPDGATAATWPELWRAVKYEEADVVSLSGLQVGIVRQLLSSAIGNRLIYPDGSTHPIAAMCINKRLKEALA